MSQNTEHSEHIVSVWLYLAIFATLLVFTGVTAVVAFIDLSANIGGHVVNFNPLVALAIAIFKATLVILFFMHVKYSSRLTKIVVGAGVFWLLILLSLTMTDYLSRSLQTAPPMH
ncbi:MAG TPA: cytochrome C oxidase subunit IV family protein [Terriglobales bacterium]|jgi:cytochrome c oxidase subunit 4|nr:cytochrome C oxidase subunit IV family protein [Terriglobales bacterium]